MNAATVYGDHLPVRNGAAQQANDRTLVIYGLLGAHLGAFGVLLFWIMGMILLFTGNGGQILDMHLTELERTLYLAYPVVVLVSFGAWIFYALKRDLLALGLAGLPVVAAIGYYVYLVSFR